MPENTLQKPSKTEVWNGKVKLLLCLALDLPPKVRKKPETQQTIVN